MHSRESFYKLALRFPRAALAAMPDSQIRKLYRSIGEVSRRTDLEPHVLRYWESEFDRLHPRKNRAGRRVYTKEDVAVVERIRHLLRDQKYTIEGARQVLDREERGDAPARREALLRLRSFLVELREKL
jgi:DNA-binding transcriptional MerR regulator